MTGILISNQTEIGLGPLSVKTPTENITILIKTYPIGSIIIISLVIILIFHKPIAWLIKSLISTCKDLFQGDRTDKILSNTIDILTYVKPKE